MKPRYLSIFAICIVSFFLAYNGSNAAVSSPMEDTFRFKKGVLDLCLHIVNPSLKQYLISFKEEAIRKGMFVYRKESETYRHLRDHDRLLKEITSLYKALKVRLQDRYRDVWHYNNVIQFGVLADLVIRYMGYELGAPVYVHWEGFRKIEDDPSPYLRNFGYNNKDINATVNAISNIWLNAWGEIEGSQRAGYSFFSLPEKAKDEAIVTYSSTSGGASVEIAEAAKEPCPKPYIKIIKTVSQKAAEPGDQVKIRGHRFGTEKGQVIFSPGVKAKILEWTNTWILVVIPQSAVTGPVTVTVPCGSVSNEEYFTIKRSE